MNFYQQSKVIIIIIIIIKSLNAIKQLNEVQSKSSFFL